MQRISQMHPCHVVSNITHPHSPDKLFVCDTGVKVAVCEVPFHYIASEQQGGLGGTCVLRGCVPKKLLSYGGEFINEFKAAEGYG